MSHLYPSSKKKKDVCDLLSPIVTAKAILENFKQVSLHTHLWLSKASTHAVSKGLVSIRQEKMYSWYQPGRGRSSCFEAQFGIRGEGKYKNLWLY